MLRIFQNKGLCVRRYILPLVLLATIVLAVSVGGQLSLHSARLALTISQVFKGVLELILPYMVFFFVLSGLLSFKKNTPVVIGVLLGCIVASNVLLSFLIYGVARLYIPLTIDRIFSVELTAATALTPLWKLPFVPLFSTRQALVGALALGMMSSFVNVPYVATVVTCARRCIEWVLAYGVVPFLPLYVFGFLVKLQYEGVTHYLFSHYFPALVLILVVVHVYLVLLFYGVAFGNMSRAWRYMKAVLPSYVTAFSTMSSSVSIPVTLKCAIKNTHNKPLATLAVPILANVHLLGAAVTIPVLSLTSIYMFLGTFPSFIVWSKFVFYFCTMMFAVATVPAGSIIIMGPLLGSMFGFSGEILGIITTLFILLDSVTAAGNVTGDGALIILVHKILRRLRITMHE